MVKNTGSNSCLTQYNTLTIAYWDKEIQAVSICVVWYSKRFCKFNKLFKLIIFIRFGYDLMFINVIIAYVYFIKAIWLHILYFYKKKGKNKITCFKMYFKPKTKNEKLPYQDVDFERIQNKYFPI